MVICFVVSLVDRQGGPCVAGVILGSRNHFRRLAVADLTVAK